MGGLARRGQMLLLDLGSRGRRRYGEPDGDEKRPESCPMGFPATQLSDL